MIRTLSLALVVAGLTACAEEGGSSRTATAPSTETTPATETASPDEETTATPTETQDGPPPTGPGSVLTRFVRAASARDIDVMWELMSVPTRQRLGPSLAAFEARTGPSLARQIGVFRPRRARIFLEEPVAGVFAVAAYGGRTRTGPYGVFAAALRLESDGWRLELGGPVELRALGPDPGARESGAVQVAAAVEAEAPVVEAGMWLDGTAVPGRTSGTGAGTVTMFSDATGKIPRGPHGVVAFASTGMDASALGWTFVYE